MKKSLSKRNASKPPNRRTNPHIPVPIQPLPHTIQEAQSDPLPAFIPPFRVKYESFVYPFAISSPLSIFMLFLRIPGAIDVYNHGMNGG